MLDDPIFEIVLFDNGQASKEYYAYYQSRGVQLLQLALHTPVLGRIPKVRVFWYEHRMRNAIKDLGPFDVIHLHFVSHEKFRYLPSSISKKARLIASFWGSDIYRRSRSKLMQLKRNLASCSVITLSGKRMFNTFRGYYGSIFDHMLKPVFFGIKAFDEIDTVKEKWNKRQCKEYFGVHTSSFVVSIGYNRMETQQHDKVLEELVRLPKELLEKVTLIMPFTYGECSKEYEMRVLSLLEQLQVPFIIIQGFQTDERIAMLRIATDIYINAQVTDAFSASVQQYLYAGALLLNPVWLQYDELNDWGIWYQEYQDFAELPALLWKELQNEPREFMENANILQSKTSWLSVQHSWLDTYQPASQKE